MNSFRRRAYDEPDPNIEATPDFSCKKECEEHRVQDTLTDVKDVITHLPKKYFKTLSTNTNLCLENTRTGMKTIVGRIKRMQKKRVEQKQNKSRTPQILLALAIAAGLLVLGGVVYVFVKSVVYSYQVAKPQAQEQSAKPGN
jgi:hypothetical protein